MNPKFITVTTDLDVNNVQTSAATNTTTLAAEAEESHIDTEGMVSDGEAATEMDNKQQNHDLGGRVAT